MNGISQKGIPMLRTVFLDLQRSVCSVRFLFGTIFVLTWMTVNIGNALLNYQTVFETGIVTLLRLALDGSNMGPVLLVIAAIPFSTMYLTEKECGFQQEMAKRVGIRAYSISKVIATFLSAFLLAVVGISLFLGMLTLLKIPHTPPYEAMAIYFEGLSVTHGVGWYYTVKIIITGFVCGLAAVFALFTSSYISNAYAAILSPMIGYYLWICALNLLYPLWPSSGIWQMVSPINLFFAQVWLGSALPSFLWTTGFLLILTIALGTQFVKRSCREVKI